MVDSWMAFGAARSAGVVMVIARACGVLGAASPSLAQGTQVPLPPHHSVYVGESRGYRFTAQAPFTMVEVQILSPSGEHVGFIVRINGDVVLRSIRHVPHANPVRIPIRTGDAVDIIGNASPWNFGANTAWNSMTDNIPVEVPIQGVPHTLAPCAWSWDINDSLWKNGTYQALTNAPLGRVFIRTAPESTTLEACCLPDGSCQLLTFAECFHQSGTSRGPGSTCAEPCPQFGACCAFDGQCAVLTEAECLHRRWVWQGAGTACGSCPAALPRVWKNCNLPTGDFSLTGVRAPANTVWSEVARDDADPLLANTTAGYAVSGQRRLSDDFTVPPGGSVRLSFVKVPVHQTGAMGITVVGATLRVLNGPPDDPASLVIFGDTTTNRLAHAELSDIYRVFSTIVPPTCGSLTPVTLSRRIQWAYIAAPVMLGPGTYWLDWNITGDPGAFLFGTPATHPSAIGRLCAPGNTNALQYVMAGWEPVIDTGQGCSPTLAQQDLYFEVFSAPGPTCYANCDHSSQPPILNIDDFTCFINHFAAGSALPHPQQLTHYANCDGSAAAPALNVDDFTCFINRFALGCR